jgi:ankyrin repeat protein
MRSLFNPNEPHLVTWLQIFDIDPESDGYDFGEPNPLYYASLCGFHDLVEHLVINHPQLVNTIYGVFDTPLLAALSRKHFRVAEFLLQHGGNVEIRGKGGQTPLHIAITDCWRVDTVLTETTSFLLKHGADVNSRDGDLCTPLHLAALWSEPGEAHFLLEHGAEIEGRNREGRTPLHLVFKDGPDGMFDWGLDHQLSFVRLFLEHGTNVNAQDQHGYTPLYLAKLQESWEVVRILLENGAILDMKTENNSQPSLHLLLRGIFSHGDDLDLARLLLERGAKVNARWQGGETPLHLAVQWEFYEIAGVLLEYGADPDAEDDSGRTPLHLLLLTDQMFSEDSVQGLGLLRSLLENGADVNSQNGAHASPLHLAMELELYDVAQILLEHGAEPNMKNNKGKTPLHLLLEREYDDHDDADDVLVVGRLLLESGADVNAKDEDNTTPLHLVSNHHTPEIAQVILDHANAKKDRRRALLHLTLEGKYNF